MKRLFIEQPLALPGSAKHDQECILLKCFLEEKKASTNYLSNIYFGKFFLCEHWNHKLRARNPLLAHTETVYLSVRYKCSTFALGQIHVFSHSTPMTHICN